MQDKTTYPTISSGILNQIQDNKFIDPLETQSSHQNPINLTPITSRQEWIGSSIGRWTKEEHYKFIEGTMLIST